MRKLNLFVATSLLLLSSTVSAQTMNYLALGDSYTIGESVSEGDNWPNQLATRLVESGQFASVDVEFIAKTGWRTDDLIVAIERADLPSEHDQVSLLIGVNNQYQGKAIAQYKKEFTQLLERSISLAGGNSSNVFVVSIPDYFYTPFGQKNKNGTEKISQELDKYNAFAKKVCQEHRVQFIDITPISRTWQPESDLVAPDGLHPSVSQYTLWVEEIMLQRFAN